MENEILTVKLRPIKIGDLDDILQIETVSYGEHHWSRDSFINEINNKLAHYWCVVDKKGRILGYLGFWIIFEEAHVTTLAVTPEYRRSQIAQSLIFNMLDICYKNEVKFITLEVRVSNTPAIGLYEKNGFKTIGVRKNYYQDNNEDALIMFTENIWYDKFKSIYNKNKENMTRILVQEQ